MQEEDYDEDGNPIPRPPEVDLNSPRPWYGKNSSFSGFLMYRLWKDNTITTATYKIVCL